MRHSACSHAESGLKMSAHPCSRRRGAEACQSTRIPCKARRWTARSAAPRRCRQIARPAGTHSLCSVSGQLAQQGETGSAKEKGAHPGWGTRKRASSAFSGIRFATQAISNSARLASTRALPQSEGQLLLAERVRAQQALSQHEGALLYGERGGLCARCAEALCTAPTTFHNTRGRQV